jgi:hypothetical protein
VIQVPTKRLIRFKTVALSDPLTYQAMLNDHVQSWTKLSSTEAEIHDEQGSDFPALRAHFLRNGYASDFYGQRTTDGDHLNWTHTRAGTVIMTNSGQVLDEGQPTPTPLEELHK